MGAGGSFRTQGIDIGSGGRRQRVTVMGATRLRGWEVSRSTDQGRETLAPLHPRRRAMKVSDYAITIFLGVILAVHLAMNGKVGSAIDNPRVANARFWCIGAPPPPLSAPPVGVLEPSMALKTSTPRYSPRACWGLAWSLPSRGSSHEWARKAFSSP